MLHAVIHGKAARIELDGKSVSWREVFKTREDLLTAAFFSRIPYLSDDLIFKVMVVLLGYESDYLVENLGKYKDMVFWPKLYEVENRNHVEPDVLMKFEKGEVLIEVKPPNTRQSLSQWKAEVDAFLEEVEDGKSLYFLALGGNRKEWKSDIDSLEKHYAEVELSASANNWKYVGEQVQRLLASSVGADRRVFQDIAQSLELHGIHKPLKPFTDLLEFNKSYDMEMLRRWT